jgi:hypothetical protein
MRTATDSQTVKGSQHQLHEQLEAVEQLWDNCAPKQLGTWIADQCESTSRHAPGGS